MNVPWQADLNKQLPYKKPDSDADVRFPHDIQHVVANLQEQYQHQHRPLRVVSTLA
jgi:hypothetical protein